MSERPEDAEMGLVFPFTVCESNGGPYADDAFVAGCYFGGIQARVESGTTDLIEQYVPSGLVPQLDLLAMHHGWHIDAEPWPDFPDDWTWVVLGAPPQNGSDSA